MFLARTCPDAISRTLIWRKTIYAAPKAQKCICFPNRKNPSASCENALEIPLFRKDEIDLTGHMTKSDSILPMFFDTHDAEAYQCRLAVAHAINPQHHVVINGLTGYLRNLWRLGKDKEGKMAPVFINYNSKILTLLAGLAMKALVRRVKLISIAYPPYGLARCFDLIATLPFENPVIPYATEIVAIKTLPDCRSQNPVHSIEGWFANDNIPAGRKRVAIIVGENPKVGGRTLPFTERHAQKFIREILEARRDVECDLVLITCRRTPRKVESLLKEKLACFCQETHFFWDGGDKPNTSEVRDAFFSDADAIIVTADCMTTLSRAVHSGRPVRVFKPDRLRASDSNTFCDALLSGGYIAQLHCGPLTFHKMEPIENPSRQIAARVGSLLHAGLG
jgi:mitochondrial fission protein ELM1